MTDVPATNDILLATEDVSLSFGSVRALVDVSITLRRGEITALVGDNGAGKSTLVRCICGIHRPDSGTVVFDGSPTHFRSPEDAREAGIETVHQNLALVEDLTVWQNLFLNRELVRRLGPLAVLDRRAMQRRAQEMVSTLAVNVPAVRSRVRRLSGGQRQAVSICRAAGFSSKLVIMDEPTAALGVQETARVEELIVRLRDEGHAVLLISHNFAQVLRLSDHVWVMRAGRCVGGRRTAETDGEEIVALITGARAG
jgi:D-xylose transport system ATP-binding protein